MNFKTKNEMKIKMKFGMVFVAGRDWYDFCGGDGFTYKILTNR